MIEFNTYDRLRDFNRFLKNLQTESLAVLLDMFLYANIDLFSILPETLKQLKDLLDKFLP